MQATDTLLDLHLFQERTGLLAIAGWLITAALAAALVGLLAAAGFVRAFVPVALGLTTTALGTLLPILRDNDLLHGRFGRYLLAAGAAGGCSRSSPSPCSWGPTTSSWPWARWPRWASWP